MFIIAGAYRRRDACHFILNDTQDTTKKLNTPLFAYLY